MPLVAIYIERKTKAIIQSNFSILKIMQDCNSSFKIHLFSQAIMENFEQFEGGNALNRPKEGHSSFHAGRDAYKKMGADEKETAVHEEMSRLSRLPQNSVYATHRMRVLNKILQLLSIQRTTSQDEELELLFAGLSLG